VGDALAIIGIAISVGVSLALVVVSLIVARLRRVSRRSSELEDMRDMHLAAMAYIFTLEKAYQEACFSLGNKPDWGALDKPDILKRSFLAKKAVDEGNREIAELIAAFTAIQEQLKANLPQRSTED
jgi:hypothetical protein